MKELRIEDLFDETHPFASFHDARIKRISLDYLKREAIFDCVLYIGDADEKWREDAVAAGRLIFSGLLYCVIAPPDENYSYGDEQGLDISNDGSIATLASNEYYQSQVAMLPKDIPDDAFVHYFYATNCNSLIVVAATEVAFQWT